MCWEIKKINERESLVKNKKILKKQNNFNIKWARKKPWVK